VTFEQAIRKAKAGELLPVYLVLGEEAFLAQEVVTAIREAALTGASAAFNEEKLIAGEADVDRVLGAARMMPMMAKRRLVIVQSVERWESKSTSDDADKESSTGSSGKGSPLDRLAEYASTPAPTTTLVLVATKLDARRKLVTLAKKQDFLVACEPLARGALPGWIARQAKARGHSISGEVASLLSQVAGPDLSLVADALERTMLYVGEGGEITEEAIDACVVRTRLRSVWELVDALGRRDLGKALAALADVYDHRDRGLRLVPLIARSVRQLLKFDAAIRSGARPDEAAKAAGAPPFKAREMAAQIQEIPRAELERWLAVLATTDLALKGSRRPPLAVLETTVIDLCSRQSG